MIDILFDGWQNASDAIGDDEMHGPIDADEEYEFGKKKINLDIHRKKEMAMSESSWSISEKAVLELIELVLDGQMTVRHSRN